MAKSLLKKYRGVVPTNSWNHAHDQGRCPNCDKFEATHGFFCPIEDHDCFLGHAKTPWGNVMVFQCKKCHDKFWYHAMDARMETLELRLKDLGKKQAQNCEKRNKRVSSLCAANAREPMGEALPKATQRRRKDENSNPVLSLRVGSTPTTTNNKRGEDG